MEAGQVKYVVDVPFAPGDRASVLAITVAELSREIEELCKRYGMTPTDDSCVSLVRVTAAA